MRSRFLLFALLFISAQLFSQTKTLDSLRHIVYTSTDESKALEAMEDLSNKLLYLGDYDSAIVISNKLLALGLKLNKIKSVCTAYNTLGLIHCDMGNYAEALKNHFAALKLEEDLKDDYRIAQSYNNIGNVYGYQGYYKEALEYFLKSLHIQEKIKDEEGMADARNNIGLVYYYMGNYDKAMENYRFSLDYYNRNDLKEGQISSQINIAMLYNMKEEYQKSIETYQIALDISNKIGSKQGQARILNNIGALYLDWQKPAEAIPYLEKSRDLSNQIGSLTDGRDAERNLSDAYLALGKGIQAYEHYVKYIQARDSIVNNENTKSLMRIQLQHEYDKKEAVGKAEQEKKDLAAKEEREKQRLILFGVISGLVIVVLFSIFLFQRFQITKKQKEIIEDQKNVVESQRKIVVEKNKEITDSIQYASQIQRIMLTSEEYISKHFKGEFFILYKPKDIVSGDFYWAVEHHNEFYLATSDCTGHGVPGAFMSLLNIAFLNEIVVKRGITDPAEILNEQRREIIKALNPTGTENSRDGMDCVLTKFNFAENKLSFAAANNQLWLVRDGSIHKFKGDKMPVGKFNDVMESFSKKELSLKPGDLIYTFTDGYADQFGGPAKKKFKYSQLEQVILKLHTKSLKEQREILDKTIDDWRGDIEQVDDILIIALKV
jgi:serine phosphatase RsbU (regulator of sigma subunit)